MLFNFSDEIEFLNRKDLVKFKRFAFSDNTAMFFNSHKLVLGNVTYALALSRYNKAQKRTDFKTVVVTELPASAISKFAGCGNYRWSWQIKNVIKTRVRTATITDHARYLVGSSFDGLTILSVIELDVKGRYLAFNNLLRRMLCIKENLDPRIVSYAYQANLTHLAPPIIDPYTFGGRVAMYKAWCDDFYMIKKDNRPSIEQTLEEIEDPKHVNLGEGKQGAGISKQNEVSKDDYWQQSWEVKDVTFTGF